MTPTTVGLDLAKLVFQVHGVDESGRAVLKRKLHRHEVATFFEELPRCTVFLEACGASHCWGRLLTGLGHEVRLIAPEAVKPFVKKGRKNDAVDAAALCVAGSRPEIQFVPIKCESGLARRRPERLFGLESACADGAPSSATGSLAPGENGLPSAAKLATRGELGNREIHGEDRDEESS